MSKRTVPSIFSSRRRAARSRRAASLQAGKDGPATWLAETMAEDVLERIAFMQLEPSRALVAGDDSGSVTGQLSQLACEVVSADDLSSDEEQPVDNGPFDLVISLARLDTVNDLPGALLHLRNALAPGGVLIATIIGAGSLPALREVMLAADGERASPRIHPQVDNRAATELLERAGFARQVVDSHTLDVRYGTFERLIADLREQGLTSVLLSPSPNVGKAGLQRARAAFDALRDDDGKVSERFEILTLTGWKG